MPSFSETAPEYIIIFGGGRWARVYLKILTSLLPETTDFFVCSPSNHKEMSDWVSNSSFQNKFIVSADLPDSATYHSNPVFVVNAAKDHVRNVQWAINNNCPVLVEKPVALDYQSAKTLDVAVKGTKSFIAVSHVFLFAEYIDNFLTRATQHGEIEKVKFSWKDKSNDERYEEISNYDPGLKIISDCMPHMLSLIDKLVPFKTLKCQDLEIKRGGATVEMDCLTDSDIPCVMTIERNSRVRERIIHLQVSGKVIELDFSEEPGTIKLDSKLTCADHTWGKVPGPLSKMIKSFLAGALTGIHDERLVLSNALKNMNIISSLENIYNTRIKAWLEQCFTENRPWDENIKYAFREMLYSHYQNNKEYNSSQLEKILDKISCFFSTGTSWPENPDNSQQETYRIISALVKSI